MTTEGDQLLAFIRQTILSLGVPPADREVVTEATARTVVAVMTNPDYLEKLAIVIALRQENLALRQHLAQLQAFVTRYVTNNRPVVRKVPTKRKVAPRKAPAVRVKGSTSANRRAFNQGFKGR